MTTYAQVHVIDTGTIPEIFADDLGRIEVTQHNVVWTAIRMHGDQAFAVVRVVTPLSSVPSIASQIIAAFASMLTRKLSCKLRNVAGLSLH